MAEQNGNKEFPPQELAHYDGQDGRRAYVAFEGRVYDVTDSKLWKGGQHMRRHQAAADLTKEISDAPHSREVFERVPVVGRVVEAAGAATGHHAPEIPGLIGKLIKRYPFFRRHPHPGIVHFPIGFMTAASFFALLRLVIGTPFFESTAINTMIAGAVVTPIAIATGFFTWWLNYMAQPFAAVVQKMVISLILLLLAVGGTIWYWQDPQVMSNPGLSRGLFYALILLLGPLSVAVGVIGGHISFPTRHE